MINVYENQEGSGNIISRVNYSDNLDSWNGSNHQNGGTGMHKGITRLKDGQFVIIIGSQWQGSVDYAYVVSEEEALQEILNSNCHKLLEEKKFSDLKKLMENSLIEEMV